MRAFAALVFPFEERPIAVLVAPGGHRLGRALIDHHLLVNPVDPGAGDGMMMPTGAWVALGEDDAVATHLVDRADMLSVRSHHLHMLRHAAQRLALVLAPLAPTAEFLLELGLMFTTIFIIVAIKLLDRQSTRLNSSHYCA